MGDDGIDRTADGSPSAGAAPPRGTCGIAAVRGDVTTMRAAALVRARRCERRPGPKPERMPAGPTPTPPAFPAHQLRVGPA